MLCAPPSYVQTDAASSVSVPLLAKEPPKVELPCEPSVMVPPLLSTDGELKSRAATKPPAPAVMLPVFVTLPVNEAPLPPAVTVPLLVSVLPNAIAPDAVTPEMMFELTAAPVKLSPPAPVD